LAAGFGEPAAACVSGWPGSRLTNVPILVAWCRRVTARYESHIFCPARPRAKLHRAFSVFLFDQQGKCGHQPSSHPRLQLRRAARRWLRARVRTPSHWPLLHLARAKQEIKQGGTRAAGTSEEKHVRACCRVALPVAAISTAAAATARRCPWLLPAVPAA